MASNVPQISAIVLLEWSTSLWWLIQVGEIGWAFISDSLSHKLAKSCVLITLMCLMIYTSLHADIFSADLTLILTNWLFTLECVQLSCMQLSWELTRKVDLHCFLVIIHFSSTISTDNASNSFWDLLSTLNFLIPHYKSASNHDSEFNSSRFSTSRPPLLFDHLILCELLFIFS